MAKRKITGDKAIDSVIASIEKHFGGKKLITLGPDKDRVPVFESGAMSIDLGLKTGGIPIGAVMEIFGPESSGKTSIALALAASYNNQKAELGHEDKYVMFVDLEHTVTTEFMEGIGLNSKNTIYVKPDTAEEAFTSMKDLTNTGKVGMVVLDSVDAAQSQKQLQRDIKDGDQVGGISKIMSRFLREYSKICERNNTTAIFINQIRENPGQMFGSPIVTPGGHALEFYSSIRIQLLNSKPSDNLPGAFHVRAKVIKNKVAAPTQDYIEFDFKYAEGVDPIMDLITVAKDLDIIYFGGSSARLRVPDGDNITLARGGTTGLRAALMEDQEMREDLRQRCLRASGILDTEDEETEETPD